MNSKILICLVIGLLACAYANKTHHQQKNQHVYSSKKYQNLLANVLKENNKAAPFLQNMKALIQVKGTGYEKIHDIDGHIGNLYNILIQDQEADDIQYANDKKRIEDAIAFEKFTITQLRERRQLLRDKIVALKNERAKIENIYQTDKSAYHERTTKQSELARILDELIQQAQIGLLENPIVPGLEGTNVSEVLAQVKEIGRGRPIEALVQLTKIFTKGDASDIIQRFQNLQKAIYESLRIDTEKEDRNLELYVLLTSNIDDILIPQAEAEIVQINSEIKVHKQNIIDLEAELVRITSIYNQRKEERARAISSTSQASTELKSELERLTAEGYNVE